MCHIRHPTFTQTDPSYLVTVYYQWHASPVQAEAEQSLTHYRSYHGPVSSGNTLYITKKILFEGTAADGQMPLLWSRILHRLNTTVFLHFYSVCLPLFKMKVYTFPRARRIIVKTADGSVYANNYILEAQLNYSITQLQRQWHRNCPTQVSGGLYHVVHRWHWTPPLEAQQICPNVININIQSICYSETTGSLTPLSNAVQNSVNV